MWELRGRDVRDGATSGHGGTSQSILAILGAAETPTPAMLASIARVARDMQRSAPTARIVGHRTLVSTTCPGPALTAWLASGLPTDPTLPAPAPIPPATTGRLDEDGLWGRETTRAMQRWLDVTPDGQWGPITTRALQARVGVRADGIRGPQTIRGLQRLVGVATDGILGPQTIRALQRYLNALGSAL